MPEVSGPGDGTPGDGAAVDDEAAVWCRRTCLAMPDATVDFPFGPGAEVFRVHRRMFALLTHFPRVSEAWVVNLKVDPEELPGLVAGNDLVRPGFHMNKRHWVTVVLQRGFDRRLVADLVEDSYDNVMMGLPLRLRPVTHRRRR